ncbi:MAG TPA: PLP-dependent cysteine synthase family protein [Fimbriimonadaceae bacterium]|nr:PLP-dependent cysteine synthase family protein [Fimbriimonadaceae bacterium]HRJ96058.1 PLP-dependent cysteine synthase family protein [Fimbriimonadaceae bacterium]
MGPLGRTVLDTIGNTPMLELRRVTGPNSARILIKLESSNPTGSKKDRMARESIEAARRDGRLRPGQPVVDYSGGSTGTSLALVCAALGHPCTIVVTDAASEEKRRHMAAYGAHVVMLFSDGGRITRELILATIERAKEIAASEDAFWVDQLNNPDATRGYHSLGIEIRGALGDRIAAYVDCVGTAHGLLGVVEALPDRTQIVAVEPAESPVLSGGRSGGHRIEGVGLGFVPPAWDASAVDAIEAVSSAEAQAMARRLAAEEGIFAGTSTGANVLAAMRIAERLDADETVVTIAVDSGIKYLSTEVFRSPLEQ